MRLHIGCGTVYLRGWVNVDLPSPGTFLASERPDLVERWGTDESDYYAKHRDKDLSTFRAGTLAQETVVDRYGSFFFLPVPENSVDSVLCRQVWEHMSLTEASFALDNLAKVMKTGASLVIDVPDAEESLRRLRESGDEFYIRHILGPRRNRFGYHMMAYNPGSLIKLVEGHGFLRSAQLENVHPYPAFAIRFDKV